MYFLRVFNGVSELVSALKIKPDVNSLRTGCIGLSHFSGRFKQMKLSSRFLIGRVNMAGLEIFCQMPRDLTWSRDGTLECYCFS